MPPPSLSTTTMVRSTPRPASAEQAVGVVQEGHVADQQRRRAPGGRGPRRPPSTPRRRCRWRRGWPAPARRRGAGRTTRRRGPASTTTPPAWRRRAARPATSRATPGSVGSAWPASTGVDGGLGRWPRPRCPAGQPRRAGARRSSRFASARHSVGRVGRRPRTAARVLGVDPGRRRVDLHLRGARAGQPLGQHLRRRRPARAAARPSGVWSAAKPGWRRRASKAATVAGRGQRGSRERGSASTGQPSGAGQARAPRRGRRPRRRPRSRPAGRRAAPTRIVERSAAEHGAPDRGRCHGAPSAPAGRQRAGLADAAARGTAG